MKKLIRAISVILCLVMLLGCITVQADDDYYQIKSDYVAKIETECSVDEVFIKADYGNHSGYDIVVMGIMGRLGSPAVGVQQIGGITFRFGYETDIASFYAYKDGEFIPVKDAFDAGLLSKSDIYNIAVERGDIEVPRYREIWSGDGITMTLEETTATLYISGEGRTDDYDPTYVVGGLGLENYSPVGLNSSIKRVVVEEGITYLGEFLFCECRGIEKVELPSTLEEIGDNCFDRCTNITHVVFPEGVKRVGNFCFEIDSLNTLTFYGNMPKSKEYPIFKYFEGTVYYPKDNSTWTEDLKAKYKGITWESWSAPKIKDVSNRFEDVSKNAWYTEGIQFCYDLDVVAGMTYSAFEPNGVLTRAQFVQMLAMYDGVDLEKYKSSNLNQGGWFNPFADVKEDAWYTPALNWAVEQGIASGMTETTFVPNQPVTREHIATFFRMYVKSKELYDDEVKADLSVYIDAPKPNQWSYSVMQWAVGSGLISGTSVTTLSPRSTATRAQACRMIMNLDAYFDGTEIEYKGGTYKILENFIAENGEYGKAYFPDTYVYTIKIGDLTCSAEYHPSETDNDFIDLFVCGEEYRHHLYTGNHAMCMEHSQIRITGLKTEYDMGYKYRPLGENDDPDVGGRGNISAEGYTEVYFGYGDKIIVDDINDYYLNNEEYTEFALSKRDTAVNTMIEFIGHLMLECGLEYSDMFFEK